MTPYTKVVSWKYGQFLGLIHDPDQFGLIEATGEYCESEVDVFRRFVTEDSTVLDCGASMGAHTVALAKLCPAGRVYAFEPQRIPFQIACGNVQLNCCKNVSALPLAVGTEIKAVYMASLDVESDQKWGMNVISGDKRDELSWMASLDTLYLGSAQNPAQPPAVTFIKLDVEGWELQALIGARQIIRAFRPVIYLEFNWHQGELIEILKNYGYTAWTHDAPAAREPNWNGASVPSWPGTPMLLALPYEKKLVDQDLNLWLVNKGFTHV
jgi:FkbM family methyltransferase